MRDITAIKARLKSDTEGFIDSSIIECLENIPLKYFELTYVYSSYFSSNDILESLARLLELQLIKKQSTGHYVPNQDNSLDIF